MLCIWERCGGVLRVLGVEVSPSLCSPGDLLPQLRTVVRPLGRQRPPLALSTDLWQLRSVATVATRGYVGWVSLGPGLM